jgi:hypothetical protein
VTLVRVYCGLASANQDARPSAAEAMLVAAVVDDAGRLLDGCEIADAPAGYARLAAMLVERSSAPSGAAVAADRADHVVTSLLTAAGSPLAIVDDDTADDYAERFADDDSMEEVHSPATVRRAVGLARALQAGAIGAVTLPTPPDLAAHKPVLAAHAALAHGRRAAAAALREVLRELYPAALRAYPDPAEPVTLAVLDALPEPNMLAGIGRGRPGAFEPNPIVTGLTNDRIADEETVAGAVTALRVAVAETPRRQAESRAVTSAVADAVRQAVAAVRACDAGCDALVATLAQRRPPSPLEEARTGRRGADGRAAQPAQPLVGAGSRAPRAESIPAPRVGREPVADRGARPQPTAIDSPTAPRPLVAPRPVAPQRPTAPQPVTPQQPTAPQPVTPQQPAAAALASTPPATVPAVGHRPQPVARPVSAPPPPPPGITPIVPVQRGRRSAEPEESGRPAAPATNGTRSERPRPTPIPSRSRSGSEPSNGFSATDYSIPVPVPRPVAEPPAPGSRGNWPLSTPDDRDGGTGFPYDDSGRGVETSAAPRVTPPWLADDLPPEPPMLRLVEPPPLADRVLRDERRNHLDDPAGAGGPLRLLDADRSAGPGRTDWSSQYVDRAAVPPVPDEGDGDLLIFAQIRSAWFSGKSAESDTDWGSPGDSGWQAAEHAAQPAVGEETSAGLPRRVPQANLVPGSPREERPLRIVRDPESIAAHTTGYFTGYRRGQEIGGYAVGGRPGRQPAVGWDFTREQSDDDDSVDFEYRSAGYRF